MTIKQRIDSELKTALLNGDKRLVTTLRTLKSVILYVEVEMGKRNTGLNDDEIVGILQKEIKKRRESADLYDRGGRHDKALEELREVEAIERYVPPQLTDEELTEIINRVIDEQGEVSPSNLGSIITSVRELSKNRVDGSRIAKFVKKRLSQA